MTKKLYYHKTGGGAEYLTDTYISWKHDGKSGREGTVNDDTKILIRIDGDITKDVEVITDNSLDLLDALKQAAVDLNYVIRVNDEYGNASAVYGKAVREARRNIRDAVKKAESV